MKKISVVIPCYNDSKSIFQLRERLVKVFTEKLPQYNYEIIYVDDCSPDDTWEEIKKVCSQDKKCKGVRNVRNFGIVRNSFSALTYGSGDATFLLFGDLQDPPEYLPLFVEEWENGHQVVAGARQNTYTGVLLKIIRKIYYGLMEKLTNRKIASGVSFYGLYDRSFIDILKQIEDVQPVLNGIIAEYAPNLKIIDVKQEASVRGKSNIKFWGRYDIAMMNLTSYSKFLLRIVTLIGAVIGVLSIFFTTFVLIQKLVFWDTFAFGIPVIICGVFFFGGVQLFFLGIVGEYVLSINNRSMKRPITVAGEKVNFDEVVSNNI